MNFRLNISLLGGKGKPACKADNLIAICEPIFQRRCGSLDISQQYSRPITVIYLPLPL
jgi:hypothetical protein